MERLTEFHNGIWGMSVQAVNDGYDKYSVFSKLAEYENTGLSPEQISLREDDIKLLSRQNKEFREEILKLRKGLQGYRDAEEQGLLIKLPCKVGDTVWDIDIGKPIPYKITGFSQGDIDEDYDIPDAEVIYFYASSTIVDQRFPISDIGENIFLTKEAAEEALKGSAAE